MLERGNQHLLWRVKVMELAADHLFWGLVLIFLPSFAIFLRKWSDSPKRRLPPGPPGWPLLGNLMDLGTMPHKSLAVLGETYGPVTWLRLGSLNTMVILSNAATEFFKNHDIAFSDRFVHQTGLVFDYYKSSLAMSPYGSFWRALRRLLSVDILVNRRINETVPLRRRCLDKMLVWIEEEAIKDKSGKGIPIGQLVFLTSYNLLGKLMLSRDFLDPMKEGKTFFETVKGTMECSGFANLADYFPFLKRWDLQGLKRNMERDLGKSMKIAGNFVKERVKQKKLGLEQKDKDFLDVLLEFEGSGKDEPTKLSEKDITIFILEVFMAGSETTSSTIEWAMTELLRNPETLVKAKAELATVTGQTRKIEESDLDNLPYLQAVIKEALRLHPPIPLLIPRRAVKDTNFMGYHIPKNTQVFVNVWSIGRDPELWEEPNSFEPERFIGSKVDYKGQDFKLIPFGAGRRICPGLPLGHRMLHMVLGYLIQHFDWQFGNGITPENVDMSEKIGIAMSKRQPLLATAKKCV